MANQNRPASLPAAQQRNFRALASADKQIETINKKLASARQKRHAAVLNILDELEKNPKGYTHEIHRGKQTKEVALTRAEVRRFRKQYERQMKLQAEPNPRGGPGCSDCEDIFECWCAFGAGPLCCYLCFSWKVIRCYF